MSRDKSHALVREFLPPVLIWLCTLYSAPNTTFLGALLIIYAIRRNNKFFKSSDFFYLTAITVVSLANFYYGLTVFSDYENRYPYFILYPLTALLATQLTESDMKAISFLIGLECLVVFFEATSGINTIFTSSPEYRSGSNFEMLYFFRPLGLSDSINVLGGKILIAIVICDYLIETSLSKYILRAILSVALIIVFSRTAILGVAIHYFIYYFICPGARKAGRRLVLLIGLLCLLAVSTDISVDSVINQLNRGKEDGVDMSYRDVIWTSALDFIGSNPYAGNGSSRFYVWLSDYGAWEHSHNSYLHLIASNGIFIAFATLAWVASRLSRDNLKILFPIMIFSSGQYGVFWGISFIDIIFMHFLISREYHVSKKTEPTQGGAGYLE